MKTYKNLRIAFLFIVLSPAVSFAQSNKATKLQSFQYNDTGMVAELIMPDIDPKIKLPAILALGGSEGGIPYGKSLIDSLATQGYAVLRLSYFKSEGLPAELNEIPLEYFEHALDFLLQHENVNKNKIGLLGTSKGAEAALLLASMRAEIKVVVAHVPSNVVWYGLSETMMEPKSSWTYQGEPVNFMPYGKPKSGWQTSRIADYYEAGFEQYPEQEGTATIEVEKIAAPILLTSGGLDNIWPSTSMAEKVIQRLEDQQFTHEKKHLHFPKAGHLVFTKINDVEKFKSQLNFFGGELEASLDAQEKSIEATFNFFDKYLKK
jgi:hypothetical protein